MNAICVADTAGSRSMRALIWAWTVLESATSSAGARTRRERMGERTEERGENGRRVGRSTCGRVTRVSTMRICLQVRRGLCAVTLGVPLVAAPVRHATAQRPEALWYSVDGEQSTQSFLAHADRISVVAPQVFSLDSAGVIS